MTQSGLRGERLHQDIERAGFYPQLVHDVVADALDGATPDSHLVQLETTFDRDEIHRHITVLVLAGGALHITHVDDQQYDEAGHEVMALVSTESVAATRVHSVTLTYAYYKPQQYRPGHPVSEVNLSVAWTGTRNLDVQPAGCEDPQCEADHGYTGMSAVQDVVLRISAEADGVEAVEGAREFARQLRRAALNRADTP
ncbi:DUF5998 family protein [Kocuria sp.]|uniref:DUF5998 family protein n=1 Tax=Kocuria sp. TaxID=1871328 RepID=UPI0026E06A74|nr:DUF5998 family protein [Kocuria sp.]MDO5619369.1 DUF5998 family protein [Kocuria sp.]